MADLPEHAAILCPLPRLDEIDRAVDASPKAVYFEQSRDGLYVRIALIAKIMDDYSKWVRPSHRDIGSKKSSTGLP